MSDEIKDVSGGCYCGKVRYRASRVSSQLTECHCSQCRKQSGHRYATTGTKSGDVEIEDAENITWFRASSAADLCHRFEATCPSPETPDGPGADSET